MRGGLPTRMIRSRVGQIETPLDTLDEDVHPIKPIRHIGVPAIKIADAPFYRADIIAHVINRAVDMTQMLKNNDVGLVHDVRLS